VPQQPRLDRQRQALLALVQMRQQDLEPCSELPTDLRWYAHAAHTTPITHENQKRHVISLRLHFLRNVLAQVPKGSAEMVAAAIRTIFAQPTGAEVTEQLDKVAAMLQPKFPTVATMLADAKEDLTAFASFPPAHWTKVWSTNPLERVNKEVKRRTNVVGIFPDDAAVLRLAGAVLIEAHDEWQVAERRYLSEGSMAKLTQTGDDDRRPKEVRRATAELVAT
jgi:putative transposase